MENPNADFHAVTKDFMHKYYGSAAENIILYRKKLFDAAKKNKAPMAYFSPSSKGFRYVDFADAGNCFRCAVLAGTEDRFRKARS